MVIIVSPVYILMVIIVSPVYILMVIIVSPVYIRCVITLLHPYILQSGKLSTFESANSELALSYITQLISIDDTSALLRVISDTLSRFR